MAWLRQHPAQWAAGTLDRDGLHAAAAALCQRDDFEAAVQHFANEWLDAFAANLPLRQVMRNSPSYVLLVACLRMHHLRNPADPASGITPSRVLAFYGLSGRDMVSAGASRVKAMLGHARCAGLLRARPVPHDARLLVLEPTPRLLEAMTLWVTAFLRAVQVLLPLPMPAQAMTAEPGMVGELFTYRLSAFIEDRFGLPERIPALRYLMDRVGGYLIFLEMMRGVRLHPEDSTDGTATTTLHTHRVARCSGLSRGTVRNVLTEGIERGWWLKDDAGPGLRLQAPFVQQASLWMGLEFVWMHTLAVAAWQRRCALREATPGQCPVA